MTWYLSCLLLLLYISYMQIALIWGFTMQLSLWKSVYWLWRYKLNKVCDSLNSPLFIKNVALLLLRKNCMHKVNILGESLKKQRVKRMELCWEKIYVTKDKKLRIKIIQLYHNDTMSENQTFHNIISSFLPSTNSDFLPSTNSDCQYKILGLQYQLYYSWPYLLLTTRTI